MKSPIRNRKRTSTSSEGNTCNNSNGNLKRSCDCCKQAFMIGPMKLFSFNAMPFASSKSASSDEPLMSHAIRGGGLLQSKTCSKTACTSSSSFCYTKMKKSPTAFKKKKIKKKEANAIANATNTIHTAILNEDNNIDAANVIALNSNENFPLSVRSDGDSSKASSSITDEIKRLVVAPASNEKNKRNQEPIKIDETEWKTSIRDMLRGEEFLPPAMSDQEEEERVFDPFHIFPEHHGWQMSSSSVATSTTTSIKAITASPSPYNTNNNLRYQYYYHHQYDPQNQSSSAASTNMPDLQSCATGADTDMMTTTSLDTLRLKSLNSVEKSKRQQQQHHHQSSLSSSRTFLIEEDDTDDDFIMGIGSTRTNYGYPIFRKTAPVQQHQHPYHYHDATTATMNTAEENVARRNYFYGTDVEDDRLHRQPKTVSLPPNPRDTYYKRYLIATPEEGLGRGRGGGHVNDNNYANGVTTDTETTPNNTDTDTPPNNDRMRSKSTPPPQTAHQKEQEKLLLLEKKKERRRRRKKKQQRHRSKEAKKKKKRHNKKKKKKSEKERRQREEVGLETKDDGKKKKKKSSSRSKSKAKKSRSRSTKRHDKKTSPPDKQKKERHQRRHVELQIVQCISQSEDDDVSGLTGPPPYNILECEGSVDGVVSALTENSGFPPMVLQSNNKLAPRRLHERPNIRSLMQLTQVLETPQEPLPASAAATAGTASTPQTPSTAKPKYTTTQNDNDNDENGCQGAIDDDVDNNAAVDVEATTKADGN